jgi:hypothetical protein
LKKDSKATSSKTDKKADKKDTPKVAIADAKPDTHRVSDIKKEGDRIDTIMAQKKSAIKTKEPVKDKVVAKEATKESKKEVKKDAIKDSASKTETKALNKKPEPV